MVGKDRKSNHTSQINFAPLPLSNSIFLVKTMTDSAPRLLPWQELRIGRANTKNRRTLNPAHKPTQCEQNCLSPSDALVELELRFWLCLAWRGHGITGSTIEFADDDCQIEA